MVMNVVVWLLIALVAQEDRHREAIEKGLKLPPPEEVETWSAKGEHFKRALGILLDKKNWAKALAAVEERTGLSAEKIDVTVKFAKLEQPAMGNGVAGRGEVALDINKLASYEKSVMEYEKLRDKTLVVIPPARTPQILHHELTHCFQNLKQPLWFLEGMATYVANDGHFIAYFRHDKIKVQAIDATYEHKHLYARGWAFFEFVKAKHGEDKLKQLIARAVKDGKSVEEAAAEVTGTDWETLKGQEKDWSAKWISSYKIQK